MSKIVKKVGRAVGKVVRGIGKALKKVVKSPLGRILLGAAVSFIGLPMLAGAINGAAAGSGFLGTISGAVSGAASAAGNVISGVASAGSGLISGSMGLGEAASTVMNAASAPFQTGAVGDFLGTASQMTPTTGAEAIAGGSPAGGAAPVGELGSGTSFMQSTSPMVDVAGAANATQGATTLTGGVAPIGSSIPGIATQTVAQAAKEGLLARAMANPAFMPAAMKVGGGLITGIGNALTQRAAWQREDDARQRAYDNWSVGNLVLRR